MPGDVTYRVEGLLESRILNQAVDKKLNVVRLRELLRINLCTADKLSGPELWARSVLFTERCPVSNVRVRSITDRDGLRVKT